MGYNRIVGVKFTADFCGSSDPAPHLGSKGHHWQRELCVGTSGMGVCVGEPPSDYWTADDI